MAGIWEEVKSRKIFKAATIYAAVSWGIIQIADILFPVVGIQDWVLSSMVLLAFAGFPVALILGWMLDIRLERRKEASQEGPQKLHWASRAAELGVISMFTFGAALLYYNSANEPVQAVTDDAEQIKQILNPDNEQLAIAVLPFASFSDSAQDEFFADGLSEELLNVLARNKKLRVAARTSSFQYKNTNVNVRTIADELGVQYVLEGSVRRSGDLIRVTAQLIKADEDVHVFSKSWDRDISNVFEVQDEISLSVMDELKVSLLGEEQQQKAEVGTQNIAAFAEYSRAMAFLRNRSKTDFENAIVHFKEALKIDPDYAEACTMLAQTFLLQSSYGLLAYEKAMTKAQPLIEHSMNLNPNSGSVHAVTGLMHWQRSGQSENRQQTLALAKHHLMKAMDINPSLAEAYMWYGSILQDEGRVVDGAEFHKKAFEIDPQAAVVGFNRAKDLVRFGRFEEAMNVFNTVVRNNPNYPQAYTIAGDVSFAVGQLDQAYNMYNRLAQLSDDQTMWLVNSSRIYIPIGQYALAQHNVDQLFEQVEPDYKIKLYWLQAMLWIATDNYDEFTQWTDTFEEESERWEERLWRGFGNMKQGQVQYAANDIKASLMLMKKNNPERADENTVRANLLLARAYQLLGDTLAADNYIDGADADLKQLEVDGFNPMLVRFQQAALASLKGEDQKSLNLLRQSVQEGFVDFWWVDMDPAFDAIRDDSMFELIRDEFNIRMRLMQNSIESQYGKLALGK